MDHSLLCKQNFLHRIVTGIFGVWCFVLAFKNLLQITAVSKTYSGTMRFQALLVIFLASILCIAVCWLLSVLFSRLRPWQLLLLLFGISLALKLLVIFTIAPAEYSDFQTFRAGAALTAQGDVSFIERLPYYKIWAYQFGIEFLIAPIFRLFGRWDPVFSLVVNGVFAALCTPLIYLIGEEIFETKEASISASIGLKKRLSSLTSTPPRIASTFAALLFTVLPITVDLSAVFTNQQLSLIFLLFAVWIFLKRPDWLGGLLAGTALGIANVARADAIVYLAAFVVGVILLCRSKKIFLGLACVIGMYFIAFRAMEWLASPLQPYGLGNNFPLYKFAVGLDESSQGRYSAQMQKLLFDNEAYIADPVLRDSETMALIKEELAIGPARLFRLFSIKTTIQWAGWQHNYEILHDLSGQESVAIFGRLVAGSSLNCAYNLWDGFTRTILFTAAGISGLITAAKKQIHLGLSIPMLAFMAFSTVAMAVEVQYRYSYFVFPAIILMTASLLIPGTKTDA